MPPFTSDPRQPLAEPVGGFPEAASWAGIEDLVGSVYQWTDVFSDDHTSRYELNSTLFHRQLSESCLSFNLYGITIGQFFEERPGGTLKDPTGTSPCPMDLTKPSLEVGRRQDLCSSRIRCFCSLTAWIVLEELVSDV